MADSIILCGYCVAGYPTDFCLWGYEGGCLTENDITVVPIDHTVVEAEVRVLKDPISTGRKRAAELYKLSPGQVCEWAYKKNCGGGIEPIVGCPGRPASHIHHGPDKSTLNNERDNISLICSTCHVRWHDANDKYYPSVRPEDNSTWLPIGDTIHRLDEMIQADKMEIHLHEASIPPSKKEKGAK